jgi:hypothetical protein
MIPARWRPTWTQFTALGPLLLVAVIVGPMFMGANLLSGPARWAGHLVGWLAGR